MRKYFEVRIQLDYRNAISFFFNFKGNWKKAFLDVSEESQFYGINNI